MRVRRFASGAGASPADRSPSRMKASIGVRTQPVFLSGGLNDKLGIDERGIGGLESGRSDHQSSGSSLRTTLAGHSAPAAIQSRSACTSLAERGLPFLGISGLSPETTSISRLSCGLPGTTIGEPSAPAASPLAELRSSPPFALAP